MNIFQSSTSIFTTYWTPLVPATRHCELVPP